MMTSTLRLPMASMSRPIIRFDAVPAMPQSTSNPLNQRRIAADRSIEHHGEVGVDREGGAEEQERGGERQPDARIG